MAELAVGFWEIGAYKTNVKRIKDGMEQIEDLSRMAKERAEIERGYVKALQTFSEKWRGHVDRCVQPGAIQKGWHELVNEADALSVQHARVRDRLLDEIVKTLALFRKENHHPSAFRSPKEIREIEEAFEKAQKQWKKLYDRVEAAKRAYHGACRTEKSCGVLVANAQADTSVSPDALSKMKDRHHKSKDDVVKTRKQYETQLQEIAQFRGPYIENMTFVFEKCQLSELKRAKFVIEMLAGEAAVLADLVRNAKFNAMHAKLEEQLKALDEPVLLTDLKEWSGQYGVDAPTNWPAYEEYTPEMRQIASGKTTSSKDNGGVILTRQIIKSDDAPLPGPASSNSSGSNSVKGKDSDSDTNTYDSRRTNSHSRKDENKRPTHHWDTPESLPATTPDSAKYADFEEDVTPVVKGREAKVLYDYTPMEDDEIALKKGELIELLSEPDSLGWCQGRAGNLCGLFPASYVQTV